jgi:hypothetical protein
MRVHKHFWNRLPIASKTALIASLNQALKEFQTPGSGGESDFDRVVKAYLGAQ